MAKVELSGAAELVLEDPYEMRDLVTDRIDSKHDQVRNGSVNDATNQFDARKYSSLI